jgi:hypothetical protein
MERRPNRFYVRALRRGARLLGSEVRLRDMLGAPPGAFLRWLEGDEPMPEATFDVLLDFLSAMESTEPLPPLPSTENLPPSPY